MKKQKTFKEILHSLIFPALLPAIFVCLAGAAVGRQVVHGAGAGLPSDPFSFRRVAVELNGVPLQFDVEPRLEREEAVFPLRRIFEEMDYEVRWEFENKRVVLTGWGRYIVLYPDNPLFSINGVVYRLSAPPFLEKGRLMVGLDFIRQAAGVSELVWDEARDLLRISFNEGERFWKPGDSPAGLLEEYPARFVEVLLPAGNRVGVGESFEIEIGAPFVGGIHAYEVRFFYNPELIKVKDIRNPHRKAEEFYMKRINNREGMVEYTQTNLGFEDDIPPRQGLVVVEAIAFRQGAVPILEGTLHLTILDNAAVEIPVAVEEKTLQIRSTP